MFTNMYRLLLVVLPAGAQFLARSTKTEDPCPSAYQVYRESTKSCVWSCSEGTRPNMVNTVAGYEFNDKFGDDECICQDGFVDNGKTDQYGRRICEESEQSDDPCPSLYQVWRITTRSCVWSCSEGTRPNVENSVVGWEQDPNFPNNVCICRPGYEQTGEDSFGRKICTKTCPTVYQVLSEETRQCIWSCAQGTTPGDNDECVCKEGYVEAGKDQFGRRVCRPVDTEEPAKCDTYTIQCPAGYMLHPNAAQVYCQGNPCTHNDEARCCVREEVGDCPSLYQVLSEETGHCVWSCSEGTRPNMNNPFVGYEIVEGYGLDECVCKDGYVEVGVDKFGRRVCKNENEDDCADKVPKYCSKYVASAPHLCQDAFVQRHCQKTCEQCD